ncbi:MAG TPA: hypothetical protein VNN25_28270 [Thermoanaerobaculia bacterium]|nr:hypothetical protein [Thermoanaerobaculia bacterium]
MRSSRPRALGRPRPNAVRAEVEAEYRLTFAEHVRAQLNELNAGLEYQVLAASNSHARQANFITPAAEPLFRRVDLFNAGNLGEGLGIRGCVITMGDIFNGNLSIACTRHTPSGQPNTVPTRGERVDWWKATTAGRVRPDPFQRPVEDLPLPRAVGRSRNVFDRYRAAVPPADHGGQHHPRQG